MNKINFQNTINHDIMRNISAYTAQDYWVSTIVQAHMYERM